MLKIIICTGFNNGNRPQYGQEFGIDRPLKKEWIEYRYEIWKKYTYQSILRQTDQNWIWIMKFHPQTKDIVESIFQNLDDRVILNFDEEKQKEILSRYDDVLIVRLDSDDMYRGDAIEQYRFAVENSDHNFFLCMKGYMFETNGKLAKYDPIHSTPFHARRVNGKTHKYANIGLQHRRIKDHNPYIMPENLFMVTIHNHNTSSRMQIATGDIKKGRWEYILTKFGVQHEA